MSVDDRSCQRKRLAPVREEPLKLLVAAGMDDQDVAARATRDILADAAA